MAHIQQKSNQALSSIDHLRASISIATASNLSRLSSNNQYHFRRKTAKWLDESFFKILSSCRVKNFIECGAHEASASALFLRTGGQKALAIEANPLTYVQKTKHAEKDGVITMNYGVGVNSGELEFFIPKLDQLAKNASFLKKTAEEYASVRVRVKTLDTLYVEVFPTDTAIALWVDVEGAALEVLKGGASLLSSGNCRVLKIEVEAQAFWENQSLARDVDAFLTDFGYVPVLRDIEYAGQYNLIYVHSAFVDSIDEILIGCWSKIALLELNLREKIVGFSFSKFVVDWKHRLTSSNNRALAIFAHRIAARLGSKSSREFLKESGWR